MRRRMIALVLALCAAACAFAGAPAASAAGSAAYVAANTLEIYKSASASAKLLGVLGYGEELTFISSGADGWAKVKSGGKTGFCALNGISNANPNTLNVSAQVSADSAPVYKIPDASTTVWAKLKRGASFTAVAMTRDNQWVRLKNGKKFGYVQAKYLSTAALDATPTPSPAVRPTAEPDLQGGMQVYAAVTELQVYAKASTSAKSRGSLYFGEGVRCVSVEGNWAKIKNSAGKAGYCQTSGLTASDPNTLNRRVQINADGAPIYKKPVKGAAVWMKLKRGASFTAVAVTPDGEWARLKSGKKYAYILCEYLDAEGSVPGPTPSPTPAPSAAPVSGTVYVSANAATVHASASASAKVLDTVPYGESLFLSGAPSSGWTPVRTSSGAKGYCQTGSLTAEDPNTYAQTVYVNSDNAPVYKLPLSGQPVWTKLKKNASFTAVAITPDNEWLRLKNGKKFAYIRSEDVRTEKAEQGKAVYAIAASLPVYAEARENSKVLGHLYLGQSAELIGASDGWSKVRSPSGASGYCLSVGLSAKDPNTLNRACYAKDKSVKLYAEPSTKAKTVTTVAQNTSLMVVCVSDDELWARVALGNGNYAYVQTDSLSDKKIADGSLIEDISPVTVYVVPTTISVYAQPKAGAKSLGSMSFGESLKCTGKGEAWVRVENSAGTVGYCEASAVTTKNPNTYSVALYAQVKDAKIYKAPKTGAKLLGALSLNEQVTAVACSEDRSWYRVKNGDAYGYAEAAYFATTPIKDGGQSGTIANIINLAKSYLGVPYVFGGQSPKGFDCSGFVYYVYKNAAKITLKRTAYTQGYDDTYPKITNKGDLKAGDVLFFNTVTTDDDKCDHAGIYLGSNQFIHASSGGGKVMISSLGTNSNSYYFRTYSWARRILN